MQTEFQKNSVKPIPSIPSLIAIQQELKIAKSHWNKFGSFNYRNAADILEAAKPMLKKWDAMLIMKDEIVPFGNFLALKSEITYVCGEDSITNTAYALIDTQKKGMDLSQITGSASSYARKTCLCGLFLIDDAIDPDSLPTMTDNGQPVPPPPGNPAPAPGNPRSPGIPGIPSGSHPPAAPPAPPAPANGPSRPSSPSGPSVRAAVPPPPPPPGVLRKNP